MGARPSLGAADVIVSEGTVPHIPRTPTDLESRDDPPVLLPRHRADSGEVENSVGLPPMQRRSEETLTGGRGRHAGPAADRAGIVSRSCRTSWHVSCPQNWQDALSPLVPVDCACGCHARHRKVT
jgi:hypothetical protein